MPWHTKVQERRNILQLSFFKILTELHYTISTFFHFVYLILSQVFFGIQSFPYLMILWRAQPGKAATSLKMFFNKQYRRSIS